MFKDYLFENSLPEIDDIQTKDLPKILSDFYPSCKKLHKAKSKTNWDCIFQLENEVEEEEDYTTVLWHVFMLLSTDILGQKEELTNKSFIPANEMIKTLQKKGKKDGCGEIQNKTKQKAISDEDYKL